MLSFCHNDTVINDTIRLEDGDGPCLDIAVVSRCGRCLKPTGTLKMLKDGRSIDGQRILELLNKNRGNTFSRNNLGLPPKQAAKKPEARVIYPPPAEPDPTTEEPLDDEEALFG